MLIQRLLVTNRFAIQNIIIYQFYRRFQLIVDFIFCTSFNTPDAVQISFSSFVFFFHFHLFNGVI